MLSLKYIYRSLVKMGRPSDQALLAQPQLETVRRQPTPATTDLAPLTQVRRSLITVYRSGRTGSKLIDHITRAVYKEWRFRSSEFPELKQPIQATCAMIAAGINTIDAIEMEAIDRLIGDIHSHLVGMGFLPETAYHVIAVLAVIEANPYQVFSLAEATAVRLPSSRGRRNSLIPMESKLEAYRIQIADEICLCDRFLEANRDIKARIQAEWDSFRQGHHDYATQLEERLRNERKSDRTSYKNCLESVLHQSEFLQIRPSIRPYVLALILQQNLQHKTKKQHFSERLRVKKTAEVEMPAGEKVDDSGKNGDWVAGQQLKGTAKLTGIDVSVDRPKPSMKVIVGHISRICSKFSD